MPGSNNKDIASRLSLVPSIGSSTVSAFIQQTSQHVWLLPDNSLVAVYQAGTDTTYGAGSSGVIVLQSTTWQSSNPTWSFVKQVSSTTSYKVATWWDGSRLHMALGGTTTAGTAIYYFSGSYSGGTWTWDSSTTQIGTATTASVPVITTDYTSGNVFVVYRNNASGTYTLQCCARVSGTWQTPFQISATSPTSSNMYPSLTRSGSNVVLVTYESNNKVYAAIHPDNTNYQTGWGTITSGSTGTGIPGVSFGPLNVYADSTSSAWASWSANGGSPGLYFQRLTFSGTTVSWQGTAQNLDTNTNVSNAMFSSWNSVLYAVYQRGSSTSADVMFTTLPSGASSWTTPSHLTNAPAAANVNPTMPSSIPGMVLPVFFSTTTATDAPIAQVNLNFARDLATRFRLLATANRDVAMRFRLMSVIVAHDILTRFRLSAMNTKDVATRLRLLAQTSRDVATRFQLMSPVLAHDILMRFRLALGRDLATRFRLVAPLLRDVATRLSLMPSIGSSTVTAFGPQSSPHAWLLPDNSMIAVYQAGTDTTYGAGNTGVIVLQSTTWQSSNPTWSFVKQVSTSTTNYVSTWWDGSRLHTVTGSKGTAGAALYYFSGSYSGGTWTWDSAATQVGTTTTASVPVITTDYTSGNIFVVYRNDASGTYSLQCCARVSGTWQTPFQISQTSPTSSNMYATLSRAGSNIALITYESNGNLYASIHPDNTNYQTGWGTAVASSTSSTGVPGLVYGPVSLYADSSSSAWVSWSASGGTSGLSMQRFTFSGTTITWQGSGQRVDTATNVSCGVFSSALGTLYAVYYRGNGTSADVLFTTLPSGASSWTTPSNLTNASAAANVSPSIPTSTTPNMLPVFFQTTTAADAPIAQVNLNFNKDLATRFRLMSVLLAHDVATRFRLSISMQRDVATRFRLLAQISRDTATRFRLQGTWLKDVAGRFRLLAQVSRDVATRFRLNSPVLTHDVATRLRLQGTWLKDTATRFRLLATTSRDIAMRYRLLASASRDVALRYRLLAQVSRDVAARFRLSGSVVKDVAARFRLLASVSRDLSMRFRLLSPVSRDVAVRLRLLALANRDIPTRLRLLAQISRDVATRFRLSVSMQRDVATRFRLVYPSAIRDIATRFRLQGTWLKDTATRFRLLATTSRDIAMRYRLLAQTSRDIATRYRLLATASRDVAIRYRLVGLASRDVAMRIRLVSVVLAHDGATRFRLLATTTKNVATRFRLLATASRDVAVRFRLLAQTSRDVAARFRLSSTTQRDMALRMRLLAQVSRDVAMRFRLKLAIQVSLDMAARFRLLATASRDVAARFRLSIVVQRDVATRYRLLAQTSRDLSTRFRLQIVNAMSHDYALRFRLLGQATRDVATRFRLLANASRDVAVRLRVQAFSVQDVAVRLRLLATPQRDVALRFRLQIVNQVMRDVALRFRLLTQTNKDLATRFRLLSPLSRDVAMRYRLLALVNRDMATRLRLLASASRDVALRMRLSIAVNRDAAMRFRLLGLATRDLSLRMRLQVVRQMDLSTRVRLLAQTSRDVALRMRLSVVGQPRDLATRFRIAQPTSRDAAVRFRLEGVPIITIQLSGRDYAVQVGGR